MIVTVPLERDFTVIPGDLMRDDSLSAAALGVVTWLLSRPPDWVIRVEQLAARFRLGRDRVQAIMQELIAAGWVQRKRVRTDGRGTFVAGAYTAFNVRQPVQPGLPIGEARKRPAKPRPENPVVAPGPELPAPVDQAPYQELTIPKGNPPRETLPDTTPPRPLMRPRPPTGAPPPRAHLCPDDFQPEGRHFVAAAERGQDRTFVRDTAEAMHRWSHANAHRPIARKANWALAFDAFLATALREAAERTARTGRGRASSANGALTLLAEAWGIPDDPTDIVASMGLRPGHHSVFDHDGYRDAHGHVPQPPGGSSGRSEPEGYPRLGFSG
jgi:hypothetical protein